MTSPRSQQRHGQNSLFGSIFLAPPSALYASLDQQSPALEGSRHMHMAPASSQAQDPFLLQPADLEASMRTRPAEPQEQGGARGLLTHLQQGRPFGAALNQEIFEEDEEEEESPGTPRGRRPPVFESNIFHDQPDGETHTATPSPSRSSHSRSPPQDLTQHTIAPCSPTSSEISSSTRGQFDVEGLRLGGGPTTTTTSHMATGLIGALLDGFKTLFTLGFRRNVNRLDRKQRALWLWVNVDDLDSFLADIYGYYAGKGIYCIALAKLINLITVGFVIAFSTFLVRCIDYSIIRSQHHLSDVLVDKCVTGHPATMLLVMLASVIYAFQIVGFSKSLTHLGRMHDFFEELLEIPDSDIQTVPWDNIVNRLSTLRAQHPSAPSLLQNQAEDGPVNPLKLDAHDVANRVMREENYMVALFNRDVLDLSVPWPRALLNTFPALRNVGNGDLTRVLEWNIRKGLLQYLFGPGAKVRKAFLESSNRDALIQGLQRRLVLLGWLNAVFAPFIIFYVLLYSFFRYFEEYHKNPSSIGSRKFTNMARWRFREYNELPHVFDNRLHLAHPLAETYLDQFPKAKTAMVARFVAFVSGAFASVLVLFSLLDPDAFLHFEITKDRSVLFYIGLFGGILAVARGMVPEEHRIVNPEPLMQDITSHTHYMPDRWRGHLHSHQIHEEFSALFQMKITTFCIEMLSVLTTPFVLWYTLHARAPDIIDFFREFTVHVDGLGYVCSFGVFDFKRQDKAVPKDLAPRTAESKMDRSMLSFAQWHPAWVPRNDTTSVYLSQMQNHPAYTRPTRFAGPGMASTTLISEEQQVAAAREAEAKAAQYTSAYNLSGAPQMRARQAASTHQLGQSSRIEEETGLGEHYEDGHPVQGPRSSSGTPSPASPSSPPTNPSLTNMLLARPRQRHGAW